MNIKIITILVLCVASMSVATPVLAQTCTPTEVIRTSTVATSIDTGTAVETYQSPLWQPAFTDAKWIWSSFLVSDPNVNETRTFTETFSLESTVSSSSLQISADDYYRLIVNGTEFASEFGDNNFLPSNVHTYNISSLLKKGNNTVQFEVTNVAHNAAVHGTAGTPQNNPAGVMYRLVIADAICSVAPAANPAASISSGGGGNGPIVGSYGISNSQPNRPLSDTPLTSDAVITSYSDSPIYSSPVITSRSTTSSSSTSQEGQIFGASTTLPVIVSVTHDSAFSITCLLIGLLLVVLMWAVWRFIVRHAFAGQSVEMLVNIELMFYAITSIVGMVLLAYFSFGCVLPMFILGSIALILFRATRRA